MRCWNKSRSKSLHTSAEEGLDTSPDVAVRIRGLTKVFRSPFGRKSRIAVNRLTMDIPKNQITVLLGHNGAGEKFSNGFISGRLAEVFPFSR